MSSLSRKDQAFTTGSRASTRAKQARATSSQRTVPARVRAAISAAEPAHRENFGIGSRRSGHVSNLPLKALTTPVDQHALLRTFDLNLFWSHPSDALERNGPLVRWQPVVCRAV